MHEILARKIIQEYRIFTENLLKRSKDQTIGENLNLFLT